jgi:hypothetical protein
MSEIYKLRLLSASLETEKINLEDSADTIINLQNRNINFVTTANRNLQIVRFIYIVHKKRLESD